MLQEALNAIDQYRKVLNTRTVYEVNDWISDNFIGYFGYYHDRDYEIYRAESYKLDNIETLKAYEGKNPCWSYNDLTHNMRSPDEIIISSIVDFYLSDSKIASALAIEVFKKESGKWKLYRQHMERY
jgi:hypothetical protein